MKKFLLVFAFIASGTCGLAQQFSISGTVVDSTDQITLIGVNVILKNVKDTTRWMSTITDIDGKFTFLKADTGVYTLSLSYVGYATLQRKINVRSHFDLGVLKMSHKVTTLKGVEITGDPIIVEQKGDTIQYNAAAVKTNPNAVVEDLVAKLPGITVEPTGVKAQGETVQQVLVDGKRFFGDDAAMALKNLPAEIVEKIEVFDRLSEQAQFTGFDDGQSRKTINIVTKKERRKGVFGRLEAGGSPNNRYLVNGNVNAFTEQQKVSLVGMSNNVNRQNFSYGEGGSRGGGGFGGGGGGGGGIATTHGIGINYDRTTEGLAVNGSYFFNNTANEIQNALERAYITAENEGLTYQESNESNSGNFSHRMNFRLEYQLDSSNSLVIRPNLNFQKNDSHSFLRGDYHAREVLQSRIDNNQHSKGSGYNFSNSILFRHRFAKERRSLSLNVTMGMNNNDGNSGLYSLNEFFTSGESTLFDQRSDNLTESHNFSSNLVFTEPLGKNGMVQINFTPSYTKNATSKETFDLDPETGEYNDPDIRLSNKFENTYFTSRAGISYRRRAQGNSFFMAGLDYQGARLSGDQEFPTAARVERSFRNLLPHAMLNFRMENNAHIRFHYRTSTHAPSISQLQNVIDNRNPLFLRTGNPDLKQNYNHMLTLRYSRASIERSSSFLVYLYGNFVQDYISNYSFIASRDTVIHGMNLRPGMQISYPINLDGYWNARSLVTYSLPARLIKSNINLNTGFNYGRTPGRINQLTNLANNYTISQGIVLSSRIDENVDFTLSSTANYSIVRNSLQRQADNNYYSQNTSLRLNLTFLKWLVFNTNVNHNLYRGLSAEFNRSIWYWNASAGGRFLKNKELEVKINAFDILNRNQSISRHITETYIEDRQSNVLTRYFMLTAIYTLRKF